MLAAGLKLSVSESLLWLAQPWRSPTQRTNHTRPGPYLNQAYLLALADLLAWHAGARHPLMASCSRPVSPSFACFRFGVGGLHVWMYGANAQALKHKSAQVVITCLLLIEDCLLSRQLTSCYPRAIHKPPAAVRPHAYTRAGDTHHSSEQAGSAPPASPRIYLPFALRVSVRPSPFWAAPARSAGRAWLVCL